MVKTKYKRPLCRNCSKCKNMHALCGKRYFCREKGTNVKGDQIACDRYYPL